MAYKLPPLPGTSSTGNTTGMPKVLKPAQRKLAAKNIVPPTVTTPARRPGSKGPVGVSPSSGGRSNAAVVAKKAAASKRIPTPSSSSSTTDTSYVAPTQTALTPEDEALQGNYDPNSLNVGTNGQLSNQATHLQLPNAKNYANSMANLQYGAQIQATASRIKGLTAALPGALEALNKAFANVDQMKAMQAPITSGAGVANLFGGAQGAAATAVNQAVQANNTTANQIGAGNDTSEANARRQADWATRIQLLNNMAVNQGRTDLAGLQGQKGAAEKGYYDQGLKMRGDMISQAISNQGALNNQKITAALAGGQLESQGLTNESKALQNNLAGTAAAYAPTLAALQVQGGKQDILNSQLQAKITKTQAEQALKGATGVTNLKQALGAGGANAIYGLILPAGAVAQNATTGQPQVFGDLNTYFNKGVESIMSNLPASNRKNVKQYVANELQKIASATNQWVYKNGRFQRVKAAK